jgi:ferric-dicitrate binding protein FerR (iron transport regulator)
MDNEDIKLLLVRYITKQATEAEINEVKHWISLHPENELYFVELYEVWQNMLYTNPDAIDQEAAYQLFLAKTAVKKAPIKHLKWVKMAAVFVLFAVSFVLLLRHYSTSDKDSNQVVAQNGAIKKMTLSDGTEVWLNAGSTIKYDAGFGKTNRTVSLEGEAFFDIGHNIKNIPFLVNTKNYTIRDIGTRFNLKAYPDDPFFETTVIKGEVAVEGNSETNPHDVNRIYVKPHQVLKIYYRPEKEDKLEITKSQNSYNEVRVSQIDSAQADIYAGWKDDLLIFDGNTLGEIARVLDRRYNVKIKIESKELQNIRYSGSFKNVPDIDKVLHIIKQNTPISYTIEGQKVTITQTN